MVIKTPENALQFLKGLGAPLRLIRHHRLVADAAAQLVDGLPQNLCRYVNGQNISIGAALHDAGKILYPNEMIGPGNMHEQAGLDLLLRNGVEPELTRFCATHSDWRQSGLTVEDLFVALADTLWKGKRIHELEELAINWINDNLKVNWVEFKGDFGEVETTLIKKYFPLINIAKNPKALGALTNLRKECVRIAKE